jgi:hypothetical protein
LRDREGAEKKKKRKEKRKEKKEGRREEMGKSRVRPRGGGAWWNEDTGMLISFLFCSPHLNFKFYLQKSKENNIK